MNYKIEVYKKFNLPTNKPRMVCICGSTKFKDDMMKIAREQTLRNRIVVMPLVFAHSGDEITEEQKTQLDGLHLWKIKNSSLVIVVCKDLYIGKSTIREIKFAYEIGKTIQVFNNGNFVRGFTKREGTKNWINIFSEKSQEIYREATQNE